MDVYENPQTLNEYLLFHYGTEAQLLPHDFGPKAALNFPARCVRNLIGGGRAAEGGEAVDLAYDLGCAVGRSTFELGHHANRVEGYDLSNAFIGAAAGLLDRGSFEIDVLIEGERTERVGVQGPDVPAGADIVFGVGDAVDLAERLPPADIVLAANLLCRLPTPRRFLTAMSRLVKQVASFFW